MAPEFGGDPIVALVPLFHGLSPDELRLVQDAGQTRDAVDGEVIVAQWDSSHELYVILEGSAEVLIGGERQSELEGGDFFGELAALDWGAGYSYSRTATVRATSRMRLLVIPAGELRSLLKRIPFIETRIRAAVRQHLRRT